MAIFNSNILKILIHFLIGTPYIKWKEDIKVVLKLFFQYMKTRKKVEKGSDFPSTLVICEKLDFFEIASKLWEKVLLDIHPSQLGMPFISVFSEYRNKSAGNFCTLWLQVTLQEPIRVASTNTCHHLPPSNSPPLGHLCVFIILCRATQCTTICTIGTSTLIQKCDVLTRIICTRGGIF